MTDPSKLASMTARAVDQIGDGAAEELEKVADNIEAEAKEIADKVRRFAAAYREQGRAAAGRVSAFCAKSSDIFNSIEALRSRVAGDIPLEDLKKLAAGEGVKPSPE